MVAQPYQPPPPTRNGENMSKNVSFPDIELPAESSQNGVNGFLLKNFFVYLTSECWNITWNKTRTKKKTLFSMSSWEFSDLLSHILIYLVHFGDQTTGSLAIFPEQRVFCLWPMKCETLVSTACRLLRFRSIHSIHGGPTAACNWRVWESIPARWSKVWKHGVPVANLLVESRYSLSAFFGCHFWDYLASMKRWNVMMYIIG